MFLIWVILTEKNYYLMLEIGKLLLLIQDLGSTLTGHKGLTCTLSTQHLSDLQKNWILRKRREKMQTLVLEQGWLARQLQEVQEEVAKWPDIVKQLGSINAELVHSSKTFKDVNNGANSEPVTHQNQDKQ